MLGLVGWPAMILLHLQVRSLVFLAEMQIYYRHDIDMAFPLFVRVVSSTMSGARRVLATYRVQTCASHALCKPRIRTQTSRRQGIWGFEHVWHAGTKLAVNPTATFLGLSTLTIGLPHECDFTSSSLFVWSVFDPCLKQQSVANIEHQLNPNLLVL